MARDATTVLNEVREKQGREPIPNPHIIAGFDDPNDPPPPDDIGSVPAAANPGFAQAPPPIDPDQVPLDWVGDPPTPYRAPPSGPPSPLIPARPPVSRIAQEIETVSDLLVVDGSAVYKDNPVKLLQAEQDAVTRIVLKALQRITREQLAALKTAEPKRPYKKRAKAKK